MTPDAKLISYYLSGVIRAKDGRGQTRNTMECYRALLPGTTPTIAMLTAQAVRAVGEAIARKAAA
jgi:hypothetical protein